MEYGSSLSKSTAMMRKVSRVTRHHFPWNLSQIYREPSKSNKRNAFWSFIVFTFSKRYCVNTYGTVFVVLRLQLFVVVEAVDTETNGSCRKDTLTFDLFGLVLSPLKSNCLFSLLIRILLPPSLQSHTTDDIR